MLNKKSKKIVAMSLTEVLIATLIASLVLTGVTLIYFYSTRAGKKGFERSEAQQSLNKSMDYLLRDLRTAGAGVSLDTCGVKKEDAIKDAALTSITLYGNFLDDIPGVEIVKYAPENQRCLVRTLYGQDGTGLSSTWTRVIQEEVLIGNRPTGESRIRLQEDPVGFQLMYINTEQTPFPTPYPVGGIALNEDQKKLVRRVDISITITDPDGEKLVYGMNTTGRLRNLEAGEYE